MNDNTDDYDDVDALDEDMSARTDHLNVHHADAQRRYAEGFEMTTKPTPLIECFSCGSQIGTRDQFCGACGKKQRPDHKVIDALPPHEQENWQHMEYWSYANDGENSSHLWDEGEWGAGPKFLGLTLEQWVAVEDKSSEPIVAFDLERAIGRWRRNDHIYDRGDAHDALRLKRRRQSQLDPSPAWLLPDSSNDAYGLYETMKLLCPIIHPHTNTEPAELMMRLIQRNPQELVAYIQQFVADRTAGDKRDRELVKRDRKLVEPVETDDCIPF